MLELRSPLAVACHDAGATNIILARLRREQGLERRAWLGGPAQKLWQQSFGAQDLCDSACTALDGAAVLLSGTGWASDLEHEARRLARERGVPSIAVIDHWVNYPARFERNGETLWPDEFWVGDEYAVTEARRWFPAERIRLQPNLYLEEQCARIAPIAADTPDVLLYVLEPTRNEWGRTEPGEFQALDFFARHLRALELPAGTAVKLRPHPSDPDGKYAPWLARNTGLFTAPALRGGAPGASLDASGDLSDAIGRSKWVAGCESFAMVVALLAGRRVICTLPPWAPECRIPHRGIVHLKQLAGERA
jgi:hypothetical protein